MTLLFLAALAALVVTFVVQPIFARRAERLAPSTEIDRERQRLADHKERIYAAIKDLDFERAAGKLSAADHEKLRAEHLAQAADVVAQLEKLPAAAPPDPIPPAPDVAAATEPEGKSCPRCAQANPREARFCFRCGAEIAAPETCPHCGEAVPDNARFCSACGVSLTVESR